MYAYRMKNTGHSSQRLGDCECCGEHVSEVFLQIESRSFVLEPGHDRYTEAGCNTLFGHRDCLIARQRTH